MTVAVASEAVAAIRDAMDKCLAAPLGIVRIPFLDADNGGSLGAQRAALANRGRVYTARSNVRRGLARAQQPHDLAERAVLGAAIDPDSLATPYDAIIPIVERRADDDGWWLILRRVSATDLFKDMEIE